MTEQVIRPFRKISATALEKIVGDSGLQCTLTTTLKTLPANTHWHFKKGKEKGVLEITLLHDSGDIQLTVQDGRKGEWIEAHIGLIKQALT